MVEDVYPDLSNTIVKQTLSKLTLREIKYHLTCRTTMSSRAMWKAFSDWGPSGISINGANTLQHHFTLGEGLCFSNQLCGTNPSAGLYLVWYASPSLLKHLAECSQQGTRSCKRGEEKESGQNSSETTFLSSQKKMLSLSVICPCLMWFYSPWASPHSATLIFSAFICTYLYEYWWKPYTVCLCYFLVHLYFTSKGTLWIVTVHICLECTLCKQELSSSSAWVPPLPLTQSQ